MLEPVFLLAGLWFEVVCRATTAPNADSHHVGAYISARRSLDRWLPGLWPWCTWCSTCVRDIVDEHEALEAVSAYFDGDPRAGAMAAIGLDWGRGGHDAARAKIHALSSVEDRTWAESVSFALGVDASDDGVPLPLHRLIDGIHRFETKVERYYNLQFAHSERIRSAGVQTASALATGILVGWHEGVCSVWAIGDDVGGGVDVNDETLRALRGRVRMVLEMHAPGFCAALDSCHALGARRVLPTISIRTPADRARCYRAYMGFGERAEIAAQGFLFGAFLAQERLDPLDRLPMTAIGELRNVAEPRTIIDASLAATASMRALDRIDPKLALKTSFDLHAACVRAMRESRHRVEK